MTDNIIDNSVSWYAVYTKPRNEKKAYERLQASGIICYLPLITTIKQWSDRKKKVSEPLIRSYIFVKISPKEYSIVLQDPAIVRFITFEGKAVTIPEPQIEAIQAYLDSGFEIESTSQFIAEGSKVRILGGVLNGFTAELIEYAGTHRIIVRIQEIGYNLLINIPLAFVRELKGNDF